MLESKFLELAACFVAHSLSDSSMLDGNDPISHCFRLQLDFCNSFANVPQSTHSSMWAEMYCARSGESSPSRKAMISSGVTGCVAVFIRGPLSGQCAVVRF